MTRKLCAVLIVIVLLSLLGLIRSPIVVRAESAYPFQTVFEQDLANITRNNPQIQEIDVVRVYNWTLLYAYAVVIRINYTAGLSDLQKIDVQSSVRGELQNKSYIRWVDPEWITTIPENPPAPWPGYVIGELLVTLILTPDNLIPLWPAYSALNATNIGTTKLTLSWTPALDISGIAGYRLYQEDRLLVTVSGTTQSFLVNGLTPGANYAFTVEAGNSAGNWTRGPSTIATMKLAPTNPTPPTEPAKPNTSSWPYLYIIFLAVGMVETAVILFAWRRIPRTREGGEVVPAAHGSIPVRKGCLHYLSTVRC